MQTRVSKPVPAGATRTPVAPASQESTWQPQVFQSLLHSGVIQAKLTVSQPDDPLEREADQVADEVMRMPVGSPDLSATDPGIQRKCSCSAGSGHTCDKCSSEEKLQTKEAPGHTPSIMPHTEAHITSLRGNGQPLPGGVRSFFEPRFGRDLSGVRIHTDSHANEAASAVQARAFTLGRDIVFGAGQYSPRSGEGQKLLAHELAHVIQQGNHSTSERGLQRSPLAIGGAVAALGIAGYGYYKWGKECFLSAYDETLRASFGTEYYDGFRSWYYERIKQPIPNNVWDAFGHCHIGCHGSRKCGAFNTALAGKGHEVLKEAGKHLRIKEHDSYRQDSNNQALGRRLATSAEDCEEACRMASVQPGALDLSAPTVKFWTPDRGEYKVGESAHAGPQSETGTIFRQRAPQKTQEEPTKDPSSGMGPQKKVPSPILYIGVSDNAQSEAQTLSSISKDRGGAQAITPTQGVLEEGGIKFDLRNPVGILTFTRSLGLKPGVEKRVVDILMERGSTSVDEFASIIRAYAAAEANPGTPRMTRLVLSGHSGGDSLIGSNISVPFRLFVELAEIFPNAANQVEHLHMAGCSTGGEIKMEDYYLKAFPKVRTIWAYTGAGPEGRAALPALARWETATKMPGVKELPKEEGVATWSQKHGYRGHEPLTLQVALDRVKNQQSLFQEYFDGVRIVSDPEAGPLTEYFRMLTRLIGRRGLADADRKKFEEQQKVALRLRFYSFVRQHFMAEHGKAIRAGYDALKLTMPDYTTLSRRDAMKAIKDFADSAVTGGESATQALKLLDKGLHMLSPEVIDDAWIIPLRASGG